MVSTRQMSTVIINCLSGLLLSVGLTQAIRFIEKLKSETTQLICIYRRDISLTKVPSIKTLGDTYIRIDKSSACTGNEISYELSVTRRKQGGGIIKSHVQIIQDILTHEIKSEKTPGPHAQTSSSIRSTMTDSTPKPQATFRTDINAREMEQRSQTPLPYTMSIPANESKILYVPDEVDDFDEEDPDDDLPF